MIATSTKKCTNQFYFTYKQDTIFYSLGCRVSISHDCRVYISHDWSVFSQVFTKDTINWIWALEELITNLTKRIHESVLFLHGNKIRTLSFQGWSGGEPCCWGRNFDGQTIGGSFESLFWAYLKEDWFYFSQIIFGNLIFSSMLLLTLNKCCYL